MKNINEKKTKNIYENRIKRFEKDKNIKLIIRTKYNFVLKFFNELNNNVMILLFFMLLIGLTGDNRGLGIFIFFLMIVAFILKGIIDYKMFKYTVYLLYEDKIKKVNVFFNKEKVLHYKNLKDIRYGNLGNNFAGELFGLQNVLIKSNNRRVLFSKDIIIENIPKKDKMVEEIVNTINPKYIEKLYKK